MSKVAIITDIHFGARRHSPHFVHMMEEFFEKTFFPYLEEHGIDTVIDGGDTFDNRTLTNLYIFNKAKSSFFDVMKERGLRLYKIVGNHECYFENTNRLNSPVEFLSQYDNIVLFDSPGYVELYGKRFLMLPWINAENEEASLSYVRESNANYVIGHLPLTGFVMQGARVCENGIDPKEFELYDAVITGHFHKRSRKGNIHYIGNPFWLKWDEYGDPRGFAVLDTETDIIEYVDNHNQLFHVVTYDEAVDIDSFDYAKYTDKIVKIDVASKGSETRFEEFVERMKAANPYSITNEFRSIVRDKKITDEVSDDEVLEESAETQVVKDTYYHIMKSIDESAEIDGKEEIKALMTEIYNLSHDSL